MISLAVNDLSDPVAFYPCKREAYFSSAKLAFKRFSAVERNARETVAAEAVLLLHFFIGEQPETKPVHVENAVYLVPFGNCLFKQCLVELYRPVHIFNTNVQ